VDEAARIDQIVGAVERIVSREGTPSRLDAGRRSRGWSVAPRLHTATGRDDPDLAYEFLAFAHGLGSLVMTSAITEAQANALIVKYLGRLGVSS